jgi:opacity protein-like surface antigen
MKRFALAASAALCVMAAAASAQPGYYVSGMAGLSVMPNLSLKNSLTGGTTHFDNGYAYGGALGYDAGNGWRFEVDSVHQMSLTNNPGGGHLYSTSLMANATYDLPEYLSLTPYVGVGVGAQNIGGKIGSYSGNSWRAAYQGEAGIRHSFSPNLEMFTEYRFSQAEAGRFTGPSGDANQHFSDHLINVGLTYHLAPGD